MRADRITLYGLALPYERRSRLNSDALVELVKRGAVTPDALAGEYAVFNVDHDKQQRVLGASVRFIAMRPGIYVAIEATRHDAVIEAMLDQRANWRGLSVSWDSTTVRATYDHAMVRLVCSIGYLSGVALCIDREPSYADTWLTDNRAEYIRRLRAEVDESYRQLEGPYWNTPWARKQREAPEQRRDLERLMCKSDPSRAERRRLRQLGWSL